MSKEWKEGVLSDLATIVMGQSPKGSDVNTDGDGKPLLNGPTEFGGTHPYPTQFTTNGKKVSQTGDLLFCVRGSTTGRMNWSDQEYVIGRGLATIRHKEDLECQPFLRGIIEHNLPNLLVSATGSTFPNVSKDLLNYLFVNLPPLPEQKAIAGILGKLDDKIELNRQMNQTLEQMAQALFQSWFVDFDPVIDNALAQGNDIPEALAQKAEKRKTVLNNPILGGDKGVGTLPEDLQKLFPNKFTFNDTLNKWIPEGWEVKSFGDVSNCFDRNRIPLSKKQREEKQPGIYPYYGATSINAYINEYIFDDTYLLLGEDGSVIKEDGTPFTQYVWGKIWVNNHAHVLQGDNGVSTEHLLTFIRRENIKAYITGAVQLKINQGNMNSIPFINSSDELNKCFAERLDSIYKKYKLNFEQTETLTQLREVLLPQLISGKLSLSAEAIAKAGVPEGFLKK
ncbi:restriction endonuclease subunit S [Reichenbachiella sp.]|uniref:restriction endonuclease subunit S n=1 Tax=Reichenbachiella sp. TaxID=2184521 RepID=UPI0032979059